MSASTSDVHRSKKLIEVVDMKFDDEKVYHPGEDVTGCLIVSCLSEVDQRVCELSVRMQGKAATSWTTGSVITTPHIGRETYFEIVQFLIPDDGPKLKINPGAVLEFPFSLKLPDKNVPCSYHCSNGYVKYSVRGVLIPEPVGSQGRDEVEASFIDKEINVCTDFDVTETKDPIEITWTNDVTNCCLALFKKTRHPFSLILYIPKSGFIIGEIINCGVQFTNNSMHKIPDFFINFIQKTTFVADDKSEKEGQPTTICSQKGPVVHPGKKAQEIISFSVPENSFLSGLGGCTLIHYEYFIEVEIQMDNKRLARISRPIFIGSINKSDSSNIPMSSGDISKLLE